MASVNLVILVGNIGADADVRTVGQNQVAKFRLATTERFRKQDGDTVETTEWHTIELWGSAGIYPYLVKGQQVYVRGSIRTEEWTGNDGHTRTDKKIRALDIQLIGDSRKKQDQPAPAATPAPAPSQKKSLPLPPDGDDLPF